MKISKKLYGFALIIDDGMPPFMSDDEHHVTGYDSLEELASAVERHKDKFKLMGYARIRVYTYTAQDVDIDHVRSIIPPERCGHEYSEGHFNKSVWRCTHPKEHKGWHHAGNKTWNNKGRLDTKI
jgi:hypothetical protein